MRRFPPVTPTGSRRAVLLDRDGTLIEERHFLSRPEDVILIPGAGQALARLAAASLRLIVITNQSGLARGLFDERDLAAVHEVLIRELASFDVTLDAILHCPHHPEGVVPRFTQECRCRKPAPGLVEEAIQRFDLDPKECFVIGDGGRDLACTAPWPMARYLVRTGYGERALTSGELDGAPAHEVVADLAEAAERILKVLGRGS